MCVCVYINIYWYIYIYIHIAAIPSVSYSCPISAPSAPFRTEKPMGPVPASSKKPKVIWSLVSQFWVDMTVYMQTVLHMYTNWCVYIYICLMWRVCLDYVHILIIHIWISNPKQIFWLNYKNSLTCCIKAI